MTSDYDRHAYDVSQKLVYDVVLTNNNYKLVQSTDTTFKDSDPNMSNPYIECNKPFVLINPLTTEPTERQRQRFLNSIWKSAGDGRSTVWVTRGDAYWNIPIYSWTTNFNPKHKIFTEWEERLMKVHDKAFKLRPYNYFMPYKSSS